MQDLPNRGGGGGAHPEPQRRQPGGGGGRYKHWPPGAGDPRYATGATLTSVLIGVRFCQERYLA